jgi:hypothetical protein
MQSHKARIIGPLKFGNRQWIDRLVHDGEVYLNTLGNFRKQELDTARQDLDEGAYQCWQKGEVDIRIEINGRFESIPGVAGPIVMHSYDYRALNVYCMYGARDTERFSTERVHPVIWHLVILLQCSPSLRSSCLW